MPARLLGAVGTALICMEGLRHVRLQPNLEEEEDELGKLVKLEEDSFRLYRFCLECDENQEIYGQGKLTEEPDVYIL